LLAPGLASAQTKAASGLTVIGQPDPQGVAVERVSYPDRNTGSHITANLFKELHLVPGATHIDMYDKPQYVGPAVDKLSGFFGQHLV
jgi:hypothetical protein